MGKKPQINILGQNTNILCFKCKNAYGGCEWSKSFDPVDGWIAEPCDVKSRNREFSNPNLMKSDYHIIWCPKYVED